MQRSGPLSEFLQANRWLMFLLLCFATFCLLLIKKSFIENETAAFEVLSMEGGGGVLKLLNTLQYASIPLIYLFKFVVISLMLWTGAFLFGYRITYAQCFQVSIVAEYIFLIPELLKILYFMIIDTDPTLFEVQSFYPFSLMNLADPYTLAKKWFYPLKAANIFEVIYWFLLVKLLHITARKSIKIIWAIVTVLYIVPFIAWLFYYAAIYKQ